MKCTLSLVVAILLIEISAGTRTSQAPKAGNNGVKTIPINQIKPEDLSENTNAKGGYPYGQYVNENTRLEQLKNKAASVNPMNLISAVMTASENNLVKTVRSLNFLKNGVLGKSFLGTFIGNLIDIMQNIDSKTLDMMIHSHPNFFTTLKKVGKDLASVAKSKYDKLAIFNAQVFGEITSAEYGASPDDLAMEMFEDFGTEESSDDSSVPEYSVYSRPSKPNLSRGIAKSADSGN